MGLALLSWKDGESNGMMNCTMLVETDGLKVEKIASGVVGRCCRFGA